MLNNTDIESNITEYENIGVKDDNKELIKNVVHTTMMIGFVFAFMSLLIILCCFLYLIKMRQEGKEEELIFRIMGRGNINYLEVEENKVNSDYSIDVDEKDDTSNSLSNVPDKTMRDQVVETLTAV